MQKWIHFSLLLANVLVVVVVISLTAVHDQNTRETEPVRAGPVDPEADVVESGGGKNRRKRSLTPEEDVDTRDDLRQAFEDACAAKPPPRPQDSNESVYTLSRWKPVAHLTGVAMDLDNKNDSDLVEVTGWLEAGEGKIVRNGFRVRGGRLVVPTPGWYRFYAFIKFQARFFTKGSDQFKVRLYRKDAANFTEQQLSSQSHMLGHAPAVTAISELREYGLYIQVEEQFQALDELYIKVSHLSALEGNKEWHYMGAHMVSGEREGTHMKT